MMPCVRVHLANYGHACSSKFLNMQIGHYSDVPVCELLARLVLNPASVCTLNRPARCLPKSLSKEITDLVGNEFMIFRHALDMHLT
jgi:hypothetical protein